MFTEVPQKIILRGKFYTCIIYESKYIQTDPSKYENKKKKLSFKDKPRDFKGFKNFIYDQVENVY